MANSKTKTQTIQENEPDVKIEEVLPVEVKIDIYTFLSTKKLTNAEKAYYQRTYGQSHSLKTHKEWDRLIEIVD
jgi:hypothetical protein